jgi:predicted AAA+ superfamily ATPase
MAQSNTERVGRALEVLRDALYPYIAQQCERAFGPRWKYEAANRMRSERAADDLDQPDDVAVLLILMWDLYNEVFKSSLGYPPRGWVSELREVRNQWAHQKAFTTNDALRALDSIERLLRAIDATTQANEIEAQVNDLNRVRFEESARKEVRRATTRPLEGVATGGLRPWRDIVLPHDDVATGRYQLANFTADLWQVVFGSNNSVEYSDPSAFFQRTYLTQGLHDLLRNALLRLTGNGGEPVMELQTNFGGGKTHSMLALYHLFSGTPASALFGSEALLHEVEIPQTFVAHRAVLNGQKIAPGQPSRKEDGTIVHTLSGEIAWQLGGYDLVAEADRTGTNPGDNIRLVLERAQPCLVLIDEWVAHARQLYYNNTLPAGSFDANMSFAQALSEAVVSVPRALLVVSLPASDTEVGGDGGKEALARLKQVFNRVQSPWRPASTTEGYEIVRRRLFQPLNAANARSRDAVIRAYSEMYQQQKDEFPPYCGEEEYRRRMESAYPFHPDLFDRLSNDWNQLDKFQQTRGVLRLLSKVVRALWDRDDRSLVIMPAMVPIDDDDVQNILMNFLDHPWRPIIEADIIGLAHTIDDDTPNLKTIHATRRVARTIFLGSAPVANRQRPGLTDKQIKLGSVQPGESPALIGDALRRLQERANYLYSDNERNWYTTQPSVMRLAQDRAAQRDRDEVYAEIRKRLQDLGKRDQRSHFARVHVCPARSGDVPDERDARLVILDPRHTFTQGESAAMQHAQDILEHRGTNPRYKKNTLVFLAPDQKALEGLEAIVRQYLAWKSICDERETLNLDAFQKGQAEARCAEADKAIKTRIPTTYIWLLYPKQPTGTATVEWRHERLPGQDDIVPRAAKFLMARQDLTIELAGSNLRKLLDGPPDLWRGDHVRVEQLADDFATYIYLDRLQSPDVLLNAIRSGLAPSTDWESDSFAYAESYDEAQGRYRGLRQPGEPGNIMLDGSAVLVKPAVALAQRNREMLQHGTLFMPPPPPMPYTGGNGVATGATINEAPTRMAPTAGTAPHAAPPATATATPTPPRRFFGTVALNPARPGKEAGVIGDEIIAHLAKLPGVRLTVTLEIAAEIPDGVPENVLRTVLENARTLNFQPGEYGFEQE